MTTEEIVFHLTTILKTNKKLNGKQKDALTHAIELIKKAKTKKQLRQALDIIIKLLGVGSNFF